MAQPRPIGRPRSALRPLSPLIDGQAPEARLSELMAPPDAVALLAELGHAAASLCSGRKSRVIVQGYAEEEAWEIAIESDDELALVSVFRSGPVAEVTVFERRVAREALRHALLEALDRSLVGESPDREHLADAARALRAVTHMAPLPAAARATAEVPVQAEGAFGLGATGVFRRTHIRSNSKGACVEQADLHGLLGLGTLQVRCREHRLDLDGVHLFLAAERLLSLAEELLDARQSGRALFRRIATGDLRVGVRRGPADSVTSVTFGSGAVGSQRTFPELDPLDFVKAARAFASELTRTIARLDRSQKRNLRLLALQQAAGALWTRIQDAQCDDSVQNLEPEAYRAFRRAPKRKEQRGGMWDRGGKMKFVARWAATVPNIELGSLFLCGEQLLVGSAHETAALCRERGTVLWKVPTERAGAVLTSNGLARLHPDGRVDLLDVRTGETRFSRRLRPRVPSGASGAVMDTPGLPKLLVVAEGDRQVTGIDLITGEIRWRHTAKQPGTYRMRRAGKLLIVTGGDSALFAVDVTSGEVVWRMRTRWPFIGAPAVDRDSVFALSGVGQSTELHHADAWSGETRWSAEIDERPCPHVSPMITPHAVVVPVTDRRGVGLQAFDRATGELRWKHPTGLAHANSAWLGFDDLIFANSMAGALLCLEATTGETRYTHVFPRSPDGDQPRQAKPVLRNGALFVPQHEVHVLRPRSGEVIGALPSDLIPDGLFVDERCGVYVAEESGHLASFAAGPRLSVV